VKLSFSRKTETGEGGLDEITRLQGLFRRAPSLLALGMNCDAQPAARVWRPNRSA
jgi:hypothetical protein